MEVEEYQWIQMAFPNEPDWSEVKTDTLLLLVEYHVFEQSCATSALCELSSRGHPSMAKYCKLLLSAATSDAWLKAFAFSMLFGRDLHWCLAYIVHEAHRCEPYVFSNMVSELGFDLRPEDTPKAIDAVAAVHRRIRRNPPAKEDLGEDSWQEYLDHLDAFLTRFGVGLMTRSCRAT